MNIVDKLAGTCLLERFQPPSVQATADTLALIKADLHPGQLQFVNDQTSQILGVAAGYGAGKTRALCAKAVSLAIANQGYIGCVMEPTGPLIRDIWQSDFDDFLEAYSIPYSFRASPLPEYVLHLPGGDTKILCRSFENWSRIIGLNLAWVLGDEIDTVAPSISAKAFPKILGRLRSGNVRQFAAASTPEGFRWMWQTFASEDALGRSDRALIRMRTEDNPHLPPDFIERLRANYDPQLLKAYLNGEFVNLTTGQVYSRFERAKHVKPLPLLTDRFGNVYEDQQPGRPANGELILAGVDFNVNNTNAVLLVRRGPLLWAFDEVVAAYDTDALGQEIRRRYPDHKIHGYPDASGNKRTTNASRSDTAILEGYGISNMAPSANPPVRDRVAAVQAVLENGKRETTLFLSPACKKTVECLELQSYTEKSEPDKDSGYDHLCFTGDTLVATPTGPVRFDCLPPSGWVIGPFGHPIPYRNAGRTQSSAETIVLRFGNGSVVRCTPNHRVLSQWGQWKSAVSVTPGETLAFLRSSATASSGLGAKTITYAVTIFSGLVSACTGSSGNTSTIARFLTGITYTIGTAISTTTTLTTLSFCLHQSTARTTRTPKLLRLGGMAALVRSSWQRQLNGTDLMKAAPGMCSTTSGCETLCMNAGMSTPARSAARCLRPASGQANTAAAIAWQLHGAAQALTTLNVSAASADLPLRSTDTVASKPAAGNVAPHSVGSVESSQRADVYCLQTDLGSFVLANGLIVSNCDALGYVVHRLRSLELGATGRKVRGIRLY